MCVFTLKCYDDCQSFAGPMTPVKKPATDGVTAAEPATDISHQLQQQQPQQQRRNYVFLLSGLQPQVKQVLC